MSLDSLKTERVLARLIQLSKSRPPVLQAGYRAISDSSTAQKIVKANVCCGNLKNLLFTWRDYTRICSHLQLPSQLEEYSCALHNGAKATVLIARVYLLIWACAAD